MEDKEDLSLSLIQMNEMVEKMRVLLDNNEKLIEKMTPKKQVLDKIIFLMLYSSALFYITNKTCGWSHL